MRSFKKIEQSTTQYIIDSQLDSQLAIGYNIACRKTTSIYIKEDVNIEISKKKYTYIKKYRLNGSKIMRDTVSFDQFYYLLRQPQSTTIAHITHKIARVQHNNKTNSQITSINNFTPFFLSKMSREIILFITRSSSSFSFSAVLFSNVNHRKKKNFR